MSTELTPIEFKFVKWDGGTTDCELCGMNWDHGTEWQVNEEMIWEAYSTGCYGGSCTDKDFIDCLFDKLLSFAIEENWFQYWGENSVPEDQMERIKESIKNIGIEDQYTLVKIIQLTIKDIFQRESVIKDEHIIEDQDDCYDEEDWE